MNLSRVVLVLVDDSRRWPEASAVNLNFVWFFVPAPLPSKQPSNQEIPNNSKLPSPRNSGLLHYAFNQTIPGIVGRGEQ
jgi:hypothetical protein